MISLPTISLPTMSLVDSELASAQLAGTELKLVFSAALVLSPSLGRLEEAWWQGITLTLDLRQPAPEAALQDLRGRLREASLQLDGQTLSTLPLPWSAQGEISLTLQAGWGDALQLQARRALLQVPTDASTSPQLAC
jgi:hypothetical protein